MTLTEAFRGAIREVGVTVRSAWGAFGLAVLVVFGVYRYVTDCGAVIQLGASSTGQAGDVLRTARNECLITTVELMAAFCVVALTVSVIATTVRLYRRRDASQ